MTTDITAPTTTHVNIYEWTEEATTWNADYGYLDAEDTMQVVFTVQLPHELTAREARAYLGLADAIIVEVVQW
jgi:hypothetical protein